MRLVLGSLLLVLVGCSAGEHAREPVNRWADERLWPVLEAQERRDTGKLCALLSDSSAVVREAAALAFASVQDSASIPCLLKALGDAKASVRSTAVFALGSVADSFSVQRLAEAALEERDSSVQRAYMSASFIAMQRNGMLKDPNAIIYYLESSSGHERVRAADALRRLPDSVLQAIATDYMALFPGEEPMESEAMLVRGLGKVSSPEALKLLRFSADSDKPAVIIPNALRTIGSLNDPADDSLLLHWIGPGCIGQAALEALRGREFLDANACLSKAAVERDTLARIALLGLAMKHGEQSVVDSARRALLAISASVSNPYGHAEVTSNLALAWAPGYHVELLSVMQSDSPAVVRQAAFQGLVAITRAIMMRSRYASAQDQYRQLGNVVRAAIYAKDPGLIAAAAELLQAEEPEVIRLLFPAEMEQAALAPLQPIRDLEARLLLGNVVAKRDGLSPPPHQRPPYNHALDPVKLLALKHGQQYRIVTNKGEVIIATDVNECPGSSLAFDSLVTSGYYNGKYFHRMVPNFVVQGGCPRGDGYGGMPWTLRTEIGRTPFTAGSVGLASAGPDTESCQFFITHSAAPHLDGRYTRFGEVVIGMDVVWQLQVGDVMTRVERLP
ncbi:MAG: peptidylprolyl isomerase [Flavobacteriales bacterium]|nr:peptidylprolyl isomerase [Flavobacteriales bacterium]